MGTTIPHSDPEFDQMMNQFVPFVVDNATTLSLSPQVVTALTAALTLWNDNYKAHRTAQSTALAATTAKDSSKAGLEKLARPVIQIVQNLPSVTDATLRSAGLSVADTIRTRPGVPASRPVVNVDTSQRLQHIINWRDEATPKSKAKPKGVFAAEVWCYIGTTAPTSPEQFKFVAIDTATPYLLEHEPADAGKTAYYNLRWVNSHQEAGPWSETVSATITG